MSIGQGLDIEPFGAKLGDARGEPEASVAVEGFERGDVLSGL
jgi:hypothetical protein